MVGQSAEASEAKVTLGVRGNDVDSINVVNVAGTAGGGGTSTFCGQIFGASSCGGGIGGAKAFADESDGGGGTAFVGKIVGAHCVGGGGGPGLVQAAANPRETRCK
jgi:hypothetical protein